MGASLGEGNRVVTMRDPQNACRRGADYSMVDVLIGADHITWHSAIELQSSGDTSLALCAHLKYLSEQVMHIYTHPPSVLLQRIKHKWKTTVVP